MQVFIMSGKTMTVRLHNQIEPLQIEALQDKTLRRGRATPWAGRATEYK